MKTVIGTLWLILLTFSACFSQSKRPVLIGIDVAKPIISLVTPRQPAYRLVEATVKLPLATNYLSIVGGYGRLKSDTIYRNIMLDTKGYYLKIGIEKKSLSRKGLFLGWHGLMSTCYETGTYSFKGPTFGDYVTPVPERRRVAISFEGLLSHQIILSQRLRLRLSGRATAAALLGTKSAEFPVCFVPGIGRTFSDPLVYSIGLGFHLFYRIPSRSVTALRNDQNH